MHLIDLWTLDRLLTFDADATDLEDTDAVPAPDQELDGPATVVAVGAVLWVS